MRLAGTVRYRTEADPQQWAFRAGRAPPRGMKSRRVESFRMLHWTDQPYKWHVNDGAEVFAVLDGIVDMHYRESGVERVIVLEVGDIFFADVGCEPVAHPRGEARILLVEREGSI